MTRTCEAGCGRRLEGRPDKRYCSEACSKRARRNGSGAVSPMLAGPDVIPDGLSASVMVRRDLEAAGRLHTYLGACALALAERIDSSTAVMGFAALVKQLESTMAAATAGVKVVADPVDELRSRRDSKRAG